jgi:hypothetical protein
MNLKEKYRTLSLKECSIPIFCQAWWMDVVCGENNWDVLLVENDGQINGALVYYLTKGHFNLPVITMPPLTQFNGLWINYPQSQNYLKRISFENEVMNQIIQQINKINIGYFSQHFQYVHRNWLPFMWDGFKQTTRYTYVIEDLTDLDKIYSSFESSKRRDIRKALEKVSILYDLEPQTFYDYYKKVLSKRGIQIVYSYDLISNLINKAYQLNAGKVIYCKDVNNVIYGAVFIVMDHNSSYYLISAFDPEYRNSGVSSLLAWEAIKYSSNVTKRFDFEGSVIKTYEHAYRGFGGIQKQYFNINKTFSPLIMMRDGFIQFNSGLRKQIKSFVQR